MKTLNYIVCIALLGCIWRPACAQAVSRGFAKGEGLKLNFDSAGSRYVQLTGLAQLWFRYNHNNPGSAVYGNPKNQSFDVGLRRVRYQVLAQVSPRVFFYSQFGINSLNYLSTRKTGLFFHDVTAEYALAGKRLALGGGLSGWNGTARFSSSAVASILALDLPVIEETTNDINDQFVRRYGIYAKGQLGPFDYRVSAANGFPVQNAIGTVPALPASDTNVAYFSPRPPGLIYQGYFMWQFLERENNLLPYMAGSYLGKKRVFNLGVGFAHQSNALWYRGTGGDTVLTPLVQLGADVFVDYSLNKEQQTAVTAYAAYLYYHFGPNYLHNAGPMNTANSLNGKSSFNGPGNAFPLVGTGQVLYAQAAYLFKKDLLGPQGTLQPYLAGSYAMYQRLSDPAVVYHLGLNWIMAGQNAKLSLDWQRRPVFELQPGGAVRDVRSARRNQVVLQMQVLF